MLEHQCGSVRVPGKMRKGYQTMGLPTPLMATLFAMPSGIIAGYAASSQDHLVSSVSVAKGLRCKSADYRYHIFGTAIWTRKAISPSFHRSFRLLLHTAVNASPYQ